MARTKKGIPPAYPTRPHNGQARLTVRLTTGKRHSLYLGTFGSVNSRTEYQRVLALLEAHGGCYPVQSDGRATAGLTLNEVALAFWTHAEKHYRLLDGSPSGELNHFKVALRPLLDLFGGTLATEFGPVRLKTVRQRLIDTKKYLVSRVHIADESKSSATWLPEGRVRAGKSLARWAEDWLPAVVVKAKPALARRVINQRIDHLKRFFAWAVSEELIPASVHDALLRVAGLRRGHAGTRETPKVKPVPAEHVQATCLHLLPQLAAMVQLQILMGARSSEVCLMRGRNIKGRDRPV